MNMFEEEAEEEEEEGIQAGLGDFGFGVTSRNKEIEDERRALMIQKGDLDHIVDELSDSEEANADEEAAIRARAKLELQMDKDLTSRIITAVTEGHDRLKHMKGKGKKKGYSFESLVGGIDGGSMGEKGDGEGIGEGEGEVEEELDEEEMLQRGLVQRAEIEKRRRYLNDDSDDSDDDFGEDGELGEYAAMYADGDGLDGDEDEEALAKRLATMTEEEREKEIQLRNQRFEQLRIERLRRKQLDHQFQIKKKLRAEQYKQQQQQQQQQVLAMQQQQQHGNRHVIHRSNTMVMRDVSVFHSVCVFIC